MFCLVYGFSNAASHSWHTPSTWGFLVAGVVLLVDLRLVADPCGAPAAAAPGGAGPQPGRRLPGRARRGRRDVRHLPVPDLLPADDPGLLTRRDRCRVPANHRHGDAVRADLERLADAAHRPEAARRVRHGAGRGRHGLADPDRRALQLRVGHRRAHAGHRRRDRPVDAAVDEHRHLRRGALRRGCRLGHAQRRPAARRLHRHRPAQHHRHQRDRDLPGQPAPAAGRPRHAAAGGRRWPPEPCTGTRPLSGGRQASSRSAPSSAEPSCAGARCPSRPPPRPAYPPASLSPAPPSPREFQAVTRGAGYGWRRDRSPRHCRPTGRPPR